MTSRAPSALPSDRVGDCLTKRRARRRQHHHDLRRRCVAPAERTQVLRRRIGCAGAGGAKPCHHIFQEPRRCIERRLHLELSKPHRTAAVDPGDRIIYDIGNLPPPAIVQTHAAPQSAETDLRPHFFAAQVPADEIDCIAGRPLGVAFEHDLVAHQQRPGSLARKPDRPALPVAVSKADIPSRQP